MKTTVLVVSAILFAGCAEQTIVWDGPKSEQEFYKDRAECGAMSRTGGNSQVMPSTGESPMASFASGWNQMDAAMSAQQQSHIFNDCMMGRGWHQVTN